MPVITLTTEWRPDDFYSGILKGRLCSLCPDTQVIDNAFNIPAFNITHASFVIRNTYMNYPAGSIHIICVHTDGGSDSRYLLLRANDHYFIGADNGIFNLILNQQPDEMVEIGVGEGSDEIGIFACAASSLVKGKSLREIGTPVTAVSEKVPLRATIEKEVITGSVIFIDSYGNAITNVTRDIFNRVFSGKKYRILIQSNSYSTDRISTRYSDEPVGELVTRFNMLDLLEVAINGGSISELLGVETGSVVRVELAAEEKILKHHTK